MGWGGVYDHSVKRCHICGKPATIFLTQITDGKMTDLALCKRCAKEKGLFDPRKLMLAEQIMPAEISSEVETFIKKMLESSYAEENEAEISSTLPDMLTECPACHYTLEEYRESGVLGCSECYSAFAPELQQLIEDAPDEQMEDHAVEAELADSPELERSRLEQLMQEAIKNENYEEAARLRDRIKHIPANRDEH